MSKKTNQGFPTPVKDQFKVYILSFTFNQSPYIEDNINGIASQETDFPFIHHIIDDASTDGEQNVINTWIERNCDMDSAEYYDNNICTITIAKLRKNPNCTLAAYFLKKNMYGNPQKAELYIPWKEACKYEAICECDDYWIDAMKLQKQVDWMDTHPEYTLCCSDAQIMTPNGNQDWHRYDKDSDVSPDTMIIEGGLFVQTATLLFRTELLKRYPDCCKKCHVSDYPLQIWAALNGKVRYFSEKTSVYRFAMGNSWTNNSGKIEIEKQVAGHRSEVDMLIGLDKYSKGKFHTAFTDRQVQYVYEFLKSNNNNWRKISDAFHDIVTLFDRDKKIENWLMCHNHKQLAFSWYTYRHYGLKDSIYSLPYINIIVPNLRRFKNSFLGKIIVL